MPTSQYMPDVKVEIAFNAGYDTPEASRVWTDVSQWVELKEQVKIDRGRSDEFADADPNKLELVVDNRDGRFTPKHPGSPYFPNVRIGRPIRVTATPVGGSASVRFVGFVEEWPLQWHEGTVTTAQSKIVAYSRMARLGIGNELDNLTLAVARSHGVDHAFPLTEPAGSRTVSDVIDVGRKLNVGRSGVTLGENSASDGDSLPGATFAGTSAGMIEGALTLDGASDWAIACTFVATGVPPNIDNAVIAVRTPEGWMYSAQVALDSIGGNISTLMTYPNGSAEGVYGRNVADGQVHHLVLRAYTGGGTMYVETFIDGANEGGVDLPADAPKLSTTLRIGRYFKGTIGDVQVYRGYLDDTTIADLAATTLTGNAGETAAQRLERIRATTTAIPASSVSFDPNTGPVERIEFTGRNVLEVMRDVEKAEGGVLFDARDGRLTYAGRAARYNRPSELTLDVAMQEVENGLAPTFDRQRLVNDATITSASGTPWRFTSSSSVAAYGPAATSETVALNDWQAEALAQWLVGLGAEPDVRIPSLSFDVLPMSAARKAAALALDIGSRITLANLPAQAHVSTLTVFVEGITETIGPESYVLEVNVSPAAPYDVFQLDSGTRGVLDVDRLAF